MSYREIPSDAIEVQVGLYWRTYTFTVLGNTYRGGELFSSEGYCFYDLNQPENYDEEGNLLPAEQRIYATYATCISETADEVNSYIVSVPVQPGYEIV